VEADGSTPIAGASVTMSRDGQPFQAAGTTNASGVLSIANVVAAAFTVRASDGQGLLGEVSDDVTAAEDGTTVDVSILGSGVGGVVEGTLFGVDGITPLPDDDANSVYVELLDADGGLLDATYASAHYSLSGSTAVGEQFVVRAHAPHDFNEVIDATGQFTRRSDRVTRDLTVPVGVVTGTINFSDQLPVPHPNVILRRVDPFFDQTFFATRVDENGNFGVVVPDTGEYVLTAQDPVSGLTATVPIVVLAATAVTDYGTLVLPQGMSVFGAVNDHLEVPVPEATIGLTTSTGPELLYSTQAFDGFFFFPYAIPFAPYQLQACESAGVSCGRSDGTFSNADVVLSGPGAVSGTFLTSAGDPVSHDVEVSIYQWDYEGPLSQVFTADQPAPGGTFDIPGIPSGPVVVLARDPQTGDVGIAGGHAVPDSSTIIDVQLGTAVEFQGTALDLFSDVFAVDLLCDGQMAGGGTGGIPAVEGGQRLELFVDHFSSGQFPCRPYAASQEGGRRITLDGHRASRSGLRLSRDIYAPANAAFTRYVEVLENPLPVDVTVRVRISGTVATANPFANLFETGVFVMDGSSERANVGFVFNDWSFALGTTLAAVVDRQYTYEWTVTIPAGETRRLLHYVVQTAPGSFSDLMWQLTDPLTVPDALTGLSPEEIASIVNFVIQP
jgi:hypothetical protein